MNNESIRDELERIRESHDGILRPEDVVAYAADPTTALHRQFQWDDSEAANAYRLWQARCVIHRVTVTFAQRPDTPIRAYVSLDRDRNQVGGGYRSTDEVLRSQDLREELLSQAMRDLAVWQRKYHQVSELAPIFAAITRSEKRLSRPKVVAQPAL